MDVVAIVAEAFDDTLIQDVKLFLTDRKEEVCVFSFLICLCIPKYMNLLETCLVEQV